MRYLGGKARQAAAIENAILQTLGEAPRSRYLEPFIGGASVFARMAPHFAEAVGSDALEDVVVLWSAVARGWRPPETLTEDEYLLLKAQREPTPLRAFAGFGLSYAGKWFGGYTRSGDGRDYAAEAARGVARKAAGLAGCAFYVASYDELEPGRGDVVYADPPYAETTGYAPGKFDTEAFWGWCDAARARGRMFSSVSTRPPLAAAGVSPFRRHGARPSPRGGEAMTEALFYGAPR